MEILELIWRILKRYDMKKDAELPWVTRLARWALLVLLVGFVAHCFLEWFF